MTSKAECEALIKQFAALDWHEEGYAMRQVGAHICNELTDCLAMIEQQAATIARLSAPCTQSEVHHIFWSGDRQDGTFSEWRLVVDAIIKERLNAG